MLFIFLDVKIFRENEKFATNIYRKKTFSVVYTNFKCFIPETLKIGLINSFLFRGFSLCSDFIKCPHNVDKLKIILYKKNYPRDLVDKFTGKSLENMLTLKTIVTTGPRKDLVIVQPSLGKLSH